MLPTGNFADDLLFMTVRLSSTNGLGTGFFFQTKKGTVIIVSNKHFVMNEKLPAPSTPIIQTIEIVLHLDNDTNVTFKGDVEWYIHPTEDLAFFNSNQLNNSSIPKLLQQRLSTRKFRMQ